MSGHIQPGEYDIVHCHVANLAIQLAEKVFLIYIKFMITMLIIMVKNLMFIKKI
jgi:hypothetical protein